MTRYRRRRGDGVDALKAAGVALGAGLGLAAAVFYLAWNWIRREPVGRGAAPGPGAVRDRPDGGEGEAAPS